MPNVNRVLLVGHLGQDPEVRETINGKTVANFTLATSEYYGKGEERKQVTQWHKVVLWDRNAEIAGEFLKKGSAVLIEGRITYETYEKDGEKRTVCKIVGTNLQMLDAKPKAKLEEKPTETQYEQETF